MVSINQSIFGLNCVYKWSVTLEVNTRPYGRTAVHHGGRSEFIVTFGGEGKEEGRGEHSNKQQQTTNNNKQTNRQTTTNNKQTNRQTNKQTTSK